MIMWCVLSLPLWLLSLLWYLGRVLHPTNGGTKGGGPVPDFRARSLASEGRPQRDHDVPDLFVHPRPCGADLVLGDGIRLEDVGEAAGSDFDGAGGGGAREGVRERLLHFDGLLLPGRGAARVHGVRVRVGVRVTGSLGKVRKGALPRRLGVAAGECLVFVAKGREHVSSMS